MSGRYWITGVQLGVIKAGLDMNVIKGKEHAERIIEDIVSKQFIGDYPTDADKARFLRQIADITERFSVVRRFDGRIELVCEHGVGHPIFAPKHMGKSGLVHGCDMCCSTKEFKREEAKIDLKKYGVAKK